MNKKRLLHISIFLSCFLSLLLCSPHVCYGDSPEIILNWRVHIDGAEQPEESASRYVCYIPDPNQGGGDFAPPNFFGVGRSIAFRMSAEALYHPGSYQLRYDSSSVESKPGGSNAQLSESQYASSTRELEFTADVPGVYTIELVANTLDGANNVIASRTATVDIEAIQLPLVDFTLNWNAEIGGEMQPEANASRYTSYVGYLVKFHINPQITPSQGPYQVKYISQITYKPNGSNTCLEDVGSAMPSLTPDFPGIYSIEFEVVIVDATGALIIGRRGTVNLDIKLASPLKLFFDWQVEIAGNMHPERNLPRYTCLVDEEVKFHIDAHPRLPYAQLKYDSHGVWRPNGSQAVFCDHHSATPYFTPDVAGIYIIELIVYTKDGNNQYVEWGTALVEIEAKPIPEIYIYHYKHETAIYQNEWANYPQCDFFVIFAVMDTEWGKYIYEDQANPVQLKMKRFFQLAQENGPHHNYKTYNLMDYGLSKDDFDIYTYLDLYQDPPAWKGLYAALYDVNSLVHALDMANDFSGQFKIGQQEPVINITDGIAVVLVKSWAYDRSLPELTFTFENAGSSPIKIKQGNFISINRFVDNVRIVRENFEKAQLGQLTYEQAHVDPGKWVIKRTGGKTYDDFFSIMQDYERQDCVNLLEPDGNIDYLHVWAADEMNRFPAEPMFKTVHQLEIGYCESWDYGDDGSRYIFECAGLGSANWIRLNPYNRTMRFNEMAFSAYYYLTDKWTKGVIWHESGHSWVRDGWKNSRLYDNDSDRLSVINSNGWPIPFKFSADKKERGYFKPGGRGNYLERCIQGEGNNWGDNVLNNDRELKFILKLEKGIDSLFDEIERTFSSSKAGVTSGLLQTPIPSDIPFEAINGVRYRVFLRNPTRTMVREISNIKLSKIDNRWDWQWDPQRDFTFLIVSKGQEVIKPNGKYLPAKFNFYFDTPVNFNFREKPEWAQLIKQGYTQLYVLFEIDIKLPMKQTTVEEFDCEERAINAQ